MQTPKGSSTLQRKEMVSVSIFLLEGHMNSSTCTILKLGIGAEIKDTKKNGQRSVLFVYCIV